MSIYRAYVKNLVRIWFAEFFLFYLDKGSFSWLLITQASDVVVPSAALQGALFSDQFLELNNVFNYNKFLNN